MYYVVCVICNLARIFIDAAVYNFYFASICMSSVFVGIFYHQSLYAHRCKRKPLLQKETTGNGGKVTFYGNEKDFISFIQISRMMHETIAAQLDVNVTENEINRGPLV